MAWWEANSNADHHLTETWKKANPGFGDLNDPADFESMVKKHPNLNSEPKDVTNGYQANKPGYQTEHGIN